MKQNTLKLSVFLIMMILSSIVKADSFSLSLHSKVCEMVEGHQNKADARIKAYDKATLLAIKSSEYIKAKKLKINDYDYDLLSYKIADRAINNLVISTTHDTAKKVCLELKASLDKKKTDEILKNYIHPQISDEKVKEIAKEVNNSLPKSIYEAKDSIPLFFIFPLEFYTKKTTNDYTQKISEQLNFMPRILITEDKELADYYIVPKLRQSNLDTIDENHSRYSMSVLVEIKAKDGQIIANDTKSRYIVIKNDEDKQKIAQKLLTKLLREAISSLSNQLNILFAN